MVQTLLVLSLFLLSLIDFSMLISFAFFDLFVEFLALDGNKIFYPLGYFVVELHSLLNYAMIIAFMNRTINVRKKNIKYHVLKNYINFRSIYTQ